jgi:hypothetical protein
VRVYKQGLGGWFALVDHLGLGEEEKIWLFGGYVDIGFIP